MSDDIAVDKVGILIPWKLFVGAVVAMLGFYVATQIAPLRGEMIGMQRQIDGLQTRVATLENQKRGNAQ